MQPQQPDNRRDEISLDQKIRELELLMTIDQAISSTTDLSEIYDLILTEGARKLIGATHGSVALIEGCELAIKATMGDDWTDEMRSSRLLVGEGITGWVAQAGEPYLVRDVYQEGDRYASWFEKVRSELAVPLKIGDKVRGVINVDSPVADGFSAHDQQLLETLAGQAGIALKNAEYVASLELLRKIDHALVMTHDLDEIYHLILVEGARKLIGASHGSVAIIEDGELAIKATMGDDWTDELRDKRLAVGQGITGWVAEEGKSRLVRDTRREGDQYVSWFEDVRSELAVPLKIGDKVRGVINVDSPIADCFGDYERQLLEMLAGQAAVALQNARHFQELSVLREIDSAILNSAIDLDQTLQSILESGLMLNRAKQGQLSLVQGGALVVRATTTEPKEQELGLRLSIDDSISGIAVREKRSVLVPDVRKAREYKPVLKPEQGEMLSELVVPLWEGDRVVGVLNYESPRLNGFTLHDQEMLEVLAGQASVALRNARQIESLRLLMDIDHAISQAHSLEEIYRLILTEGAGRLIGATHGSVALIEHGELVIKATMGEDWTDELRDKRLVVGEGITGWVAKEGKPRLVRDTRLEGDQYVSWFKDVKAELAVPLKIGDKVRGVINVDSTNVNGFDAQDLELMKALAGQAGIALRSAERAQAFRLLMEIEDVISATDDLDTIYEMILVEGAKRLIGATHGSVSLVEDGELSIKATMGADWTDELRDKHLQVGEGITGWVAQKGKSYLLADVREANGQYISWFQDIKCELAVPLKIEDEVEGVINVDSTLVGGFDEHDQEVLELLAGQAAVALAKAKMQDQLLQTESIKAVGMATAELTHWIGNKALPILYAVDRVIEDVDSDDESVQEDLEIIRTSAKTIAAIKESLLGPSGEFQMVPVMINDIVKDTVHLMAIPPDTTRIRWHLEPDLPRVQVDPVQFSQVLENLVKNAIEAMDEVERPNELTIRVYAADEGLSINIEVQDNGCGIPRENLEKVWVPFFTTKVGRGGVGVGLSASAQVIRKMRGAIYVESEPGEGTTFTIELSTVRPSFSEG